MLRSRTLARKLRPDPHHPAAKLHRQKECQRSELLSCSNLSDTQTHTLYGDLKVCQSHKRKKQLFISPDITTRDPCIKTFILILLSAEGNTDKIKNLSQGSLCGWFDTEWPNSVLDQDITIRHIYMQDITCIICWFITESVCLNAGRDSLQNSYRLDWIKLKTCVSNFNHDFNANHLIQNHMNTNL